MQPDHQNTEVTWVVEQDTAAPAQSDSKWRAFFSACVTLTLGVLGSSVLPIPFALSKTGVLVGCLTMLVVAWANDATSCMLVRAAALTGKPTYEALAEWAGGKSWKVFTQASLIVLLWGTMCGGLALISDVGYIMVTRAFEDEHPYAGWVNGRSCMILVALLVLYPLCLQRHMRELETAATAGVVLVLLLIGLLGVKAVEEGFPAIQNGELPLWSLKVDGHLPEAFSVVGYAFYMQPMMMPLLAEMPPGATGAVVMQKAVHVTLYGTAFLVYFAMGLLGASIFGQETEGNIMVNQIVDGKAACVALYGAMLLYLSLGMTTTQYALRASLDLLWFGDHAPFTWTKQVLLTTLTVGSSLAVALIIPTYAEKIYSVVGATAVCIVCYVIPVFIQLQCFRRIKNVPKTFLSHQHHSYAAACQHSGLQQQQQQQQCSATLTAPLLSQHDATTDNEAAVGYSTAALAAAVAPLPKPTAPSTGMHLHPSPQRHRGCEVLQEVFVPIAILLLGVGFSIAALYVAMKPLL
eukprot:jgi/Chrzof1/2695/Cz11g25150.t1